MKQAQGRGMAGGQAPGSATGIRGGTGAQLRLRLLETTDVHGWLRGYDYCTDGPSAEGSLSRLATLIEQARSEAPNCLLFDNGDFLQGTPLTEYWARKRGLHPGELHPVIAAMNALDYDAGTLGNHEFNYGMRFLKRALAGVHFPMISANAVTLAGPSAREDELLLPPWVVLTRRLTDTDGQQHDLRIGVIGFLPHQTADWDRSVLGDALTPRGVLAAARAHLPDLRAAGVDLVIALAHTGIEEPALPPADPDSAEHVAVPLAAMDGIDVLLCGHSHLTFPNPEVAPSAAVDPRRGTLHGKPAVSAGRWGSHLGVIDLELSHGPKGWRIARHKVTLRPVSRRMTPERLRPLAAEAPGITRITAAAHAETLAHMRSPVGTLGTPIHSYFSMVAPDAGMSLVAAAQAEHVAERLTGRPEADLPLLSAVAPFKCGGRGGPDYYIDIAPGPLMRSHVADLYTFPNMVAALLISGAELADWLERSAGAYHRLTPGAQDQALLDGTFPSYNFDVIFGVTYDIDLREPARFCSEDRPAPGQGRRICNLRHRGRPVATADRFIIATNSYRAAGSGGFAGTERPELDLGPRLSSQDVLAAHVERHGRVAPRPEPTWRFAPMPDTSAIFETSPQALGLMPSLPCGLGDRLAAAGLTCGGFQKIRLTF